MGDFKKLGAWRRTQKLITSIYRLSLGSLSELECKLLVAVELGYIPSETCSLVRTEDR